MRVRVTFECEDIPPGNNDHLFDLPEGAVVSDALKMAYDRDLVGGITYDSLENERLFFRDYKLIRLNTELHDGDHLSVILTLDGG